MWSELSTPVVIGHRGASLHAPENTLSAFKLALEEGAGAVELDVRLTADRQVVVMHDERVDRTTDGRGLVHDLRLADLQGLIMKNSFGGHYPGEHVPTLEQVFESVGRQIHMNLELKNYTTPWDDLVPRVAELVRKHKIQGQVLFSSFLPHNLRGCRRLLPDVPCALLAFPGRMGWPARSFGWQKDFDALNPHFRDTSARMIARVHARGKLLQVWTVDQAEDIKRLFGLGVDGLITDDPELALRILGSRA
jgi:glycerophosphoryl diester phosphodiesterase